MTETLSNKSHDSYRNGLLAASFFLLFLMVGCSAGQMTSLRLEGAYPSVPLPFIGDTLPFVVISPWFHFGASDEMTAIEEGKSIPRNQFVWKTPPWVAGSIVEIALAPDISLITGGELGGVGEQVRQSTRFFAGIAGRNQWRGLHWRGVWAFSMTRRYLRKEFEDRQTRRTQTIEEYRFRKGYFLAGTFWIGDHVAPMLQISINSEDVEPNAVRIGFAISPMLAVRITPVSQITFGFHKYQLTTIDGRRRSTSIYSPTIQAHFGL